MSRNKTVLGALIAVVVLVAVVVFFSPSTPDRSPSAGPHTSVSTARGHGSLKPCHGVHLSKGSDIRSAVSGAPEQTTFCLAPAIYKVAAPIILKNGDTFIGTAPNRDGVTVKTTSAQIIFDANETLGVSFRHFAVAGAINACPGLNCGPTGRAISRGGQLTIDDMHLYSNGQNGVGGAAAGLTIKNSEIDHNGAEAGDGVSAGIKSVYSMTVTNSYVHDNVNNGIWCDIHCGHFVAKDNVVTGNSGSGIFMEISQGPAVIANNVVKNNNRANSPTAGGITIMDSRNVVVQANHLSGNHGFGIGALMDQRTGCGVPSPVCGFTLSDASITNNVLAGDLMVGCNMPGVTCRRNR
jgi:parallel beta-helix repeat protein